MIVVILQKDAQVRITVVRMYRNVSALFDGIDGMINSFIQLNIMCLRLLTRSLHGYAKNQYNKSKVLKSERINIYILGDNLLNRF